MLEELQGMKARVVQERENLVRAKIKAIIKDIMDGNEQSSDNGLSRDNEIYVLLDMLKKAGLEEGKDYVFEEAPFEYNETVPELHIRIGNNIIHFNGMSSVTEIMSAEELEDVQEDSEYYEARLLELRSLRVERLGIDEEFQIDEAEDYYSEDWDYYENMQYYEELDRQMRQEFETNMLSDDILKSLTIEDLDYLLGPNVTRMVGYDQKNAHHCYDLWQHTLKTVEGIKPEGLTEEQYKKLRIAAFFHDIGKPDVAKFRDDTGQQVYYGHAMHSVEVAEFLLESFGYEQEEIDQIGFYIGHHDDFISYKSKLAPFMKNHEFIRGITPESVAEKMIENKYDFEKMGYNKDEIRAICYTLANGRKPNFRTKDGPIEIPVDMAEVQRKIDSGEYASRYDATMEDYQMLLQLCKADAGAQSEKAIQNGRVVGSKAEKLENMNNIENCIPEAYKILQKITSKDKFVSNIVGYATQRVELREKNNQAAKLAKDYEQQSPSSQPSLDDDN